MSKECKCEHWQQCPVCMPHRFDKNGHLLPPEPTPLQAARIRIEKLERDLLNLVCRIHRDGGHYIAKYGEAKAIADADTVAAQNNADLDALQADNAELVSALEDNWNCNPCETTRQQKAFDVAQSVLAKVRKP